MFKVRIFIKDTLSFIFFLLLSFFSSKKKAVLAYHAVDYLDSAMDPWRMCLTPGQFEQHLKFLSKYKGDFEITFDDGYKNNFTHAYPLLLKYNLSATFFITSDFIDGSINSKKIWPIEKMFPPLAWKDVREMAKGGMRIGAHGKTHQKFADLSLVEREKEITFSKNRIEKMAITKVDAFGYPVGIPIRLAKDLRPVLEKAGYSKAYTSTMGLNSEPSKNSFALRRIRVYREDNTFRLRMKMKGAYNWVDWIVHFSRGA